jgi:hypothetical protein
MCMCYIVLLVVNFLKDLNNELIFLLIKGNIEDFYHNFIIILSIFINKFFY